MFESKGVGDLYLEMSIWKLEIQAKKKKMKTERWRFLSLPSLSEVRYPWEQVRPAPCSVSSWLYLCPP